MHRSLLLVPVALVALVAAAPPHTDPPDELVRRANDLYRGGDAAGAESSAQRVIEATYAAPYLAHATLEPMNCTARVANGRVELWVPTQVPGQARAVAARVAGVDEDQVTLHVTLLGGGFGRRLEVDFVAQAVTVASGGEERLEDFGFYVVGHSCAIVNYFDNELIVNLFGFYNYQRLFSGFYCPKGIVNQIQQHPPHVLWNYFYFGEVFIEISSEV